MKVFGAIIVCMSVTLTGFTQTDQSRVYDERALVREDRVLKPQTTRDANDEPRRNQSKITPVAGKYAGSLKPPIKTDRAGNTYIHLVDSLEQRYSTGIVLKISPDGKRVTRWLPDNVPQTVGLIDFTPDASGGLFSVSKCRNTAPPCAVLAHFNKEGELIEWHPVEAGLLPSHIALFPDGRLFMVAEDHRPGAGPERVAGTFSDTGELISVAALGTSRRRNTVPNLSPAERVVLPAAVDVLTGDDGDVYVSRNVPSPGVFRVSPSGALRYDIECSHPCTLTGTVVGNGQMLVGLSQTSVHPNTPKPGVSGTQAIPNGISYSPPVWALMDLATGKLLKELHPTGYVPYEMIGHVIPRNPKLQALQLIGFNKQRLLYFGPAQNAPKTSAATKGTPRPSLIQYQFVGTPY